MKIKIDSIQTNMFITYSSPSPSGVNTNEEKQLTEDEK
jgi:hypothetical protein